jgi:hypothetical protein
LFWIRLGTIHLALRRFCCFLQLGNRVKTPGMKGMTSAKTPNSKTKALKSTVSLNCFGHIHRAGRFEAASRRKKRR